VDEKPSNSDGTADVPSSAHLNGIPGTLPPTWCANCQAEVTPKGKGLCPRCGRVLKGAFLARRHPVNLLRREVLLKKLVAEYRPTTTVLNATCEHLAGILEQLESLKPGSAEHQRLVTLAQTLGETLDASRRAESSAPLVDLSNMSAVELRDRALAIAARVQADLDEEERGRVYLETAIQATCDAGPSVQASTDPAGEVPVSTSVLAREPKCAYCYRDAAGCAKLKSERFEYWSAMHALDPEEQKRKDDEATKEMRASLKRYGPARY